MKTWIITLPFLCAAGVAMAQGVEKGGGGDRPAEPIVVPAEIATPEEPAAAPAEPGAMPDKAQTPVNAKAPAKAKARARAKTAVKATSKMGKRGPKTLPKGDVRHCLDLKTRAGVIRCSETGRKK